jgi:hypothetical protein
MRALHRRLAKHDEIQRFSPECETAAFDLRQVP